MASTAYGGMLGPEWTVRGFREQLDVPDDVAAEMEFLLPAANQEVDASLIKRAPKLRFIQIPGHGFDHVSVEDATAAGVPVATIASAGAESHTVAEMAFLLAGAAGRQVLRGDRFVRGRWQWPSCPWPTPGGARDGYGTSSATCRPATSASVWWR